MSLQKIDVKAGKRNRTAWVHFPKQMVDSSIKGPLPVVIALHGENSTGVVFSRKWSKLFDTGVILVFPDAHSVTDRTWVIPEDAKGAYSVPLDTDVVFVTSIVDLIKEKFSKGPFFATGFGCGAKLVWHLFTDHGDTFDGFCPVGLPMPTALRSNKPSKVKPIMMIWGSDDPNGGPECKNWSESHRTIMEWIKLDPSDAVFGTLTGFRGLKINTHYHSNMVIHCVLGGGHYWDECNAYSMSAQAVSFFKSVM